MLSNKVVFCAITGGSRGIGRSAANCVASKCAPGSHILLIARNQAKLDEAQSELEAKFPAISVSTASCDLASTTADKYEELFASAKGKMKTVDVALLIQNAGSVAMLDVKAAEVEDMGKISRYMDENFGSFVVINTKFLKVFPKETASVRAVVNLTSGAAVAPLPCFHVYGAAKAARDQFYRSLSAEEPDVRVLTYNPGPTTTDMQFEVGKQSWCEGLRQWSAADTTTGTFLTPDQTANALVGILEENKFESGSWMDSQSKSLAFS